MGFTQNYHHLILALVGAVLFGGIYLAYTSSWFGLDEHLDTFRCTLNTKKSKPHKDMSLISPQGLSYKQPSVLNGRKDVITVAPWLAPIVWEETFDLTVMDAIYKQKNITVATTVFAVGKYVRFLKDFLETAEKHFMVGYRVHYYVFTDHPEEVPAVSLGAERILTTMKINSSNRWQEISLGRMEMIEKLIETRLINEVDYMFCLDVDTRFYGHWGAETLDRLVAAVHYYLYKSSRDAFTYERRPESQAFIPYGEGDFYYAGAMFGGEVKEVYKLVKTCRHQLDIDKANSIEAVWQEESHLNKYFLYNKPTKLLSPEYLWLDTWGKGPEMKIIRYSHIVKNYAEVRPNP